MKNYITPSGVAGAVLFSFTASASAFADVLADPSPSPSSTEIITPSPVVLDPSYSVVTIDERQIFILVVPVLILMVISIAHFVYVYSQPIRLRFFK